MRRKANKHENTLNFQLLLAGTVVNHEVHENFVFSVHKIQSILVPKWFPFRVLKGKLSLRVLDPASNKSIY